MITTPKPTRRLDGRQRSPLSAAIIFYGYFTVFGEPRQKPRKSAVFVVTPTGIEPVFQP